MGQSMLKGSEPEEGENLRSQTSEPMLVMAGTSGNNVEEDHATLLPTSPWLSTDGISDAERFRRVLTIHKVCDYMRVLSADGRPKSLAAFANQTKKLRNVITFTVPPHHLLTHLQDVPPQVIEIINAQPARIDCALLEDLEPELISGAIRRWDRLKRDGWTTSSSPAEVARFIQACSYTRRSYPTDVLTEALRDLQLIDIGESLNWCCHKLSPEWVAKVAALDVIDVTRPWSIYQKLHHVFRRSFPMPALVCGAFIGPKGAHVKQFLEDLHARCSEVRVVSFPKIQLKISSAPKNTPRMVDLTVTWDRWERGNAAKEAASKVDSLIEALVKVLRDRIATLYRARMEENRRRRMARDDRFRQAGEAYHLFRRLEQSSRKLEGSDSARRAFEIAPCTSRKMRPGHGCQRKDVLRQRRRANIREKRRQQLNACQGLCRFGRLPQRLHKHLLNCDTDIADEVVQNFASLRHARDQHFPQRKSAPSKKAKDIARWERTLLDFELL